MEIYTDGSCLVNPNGRGAWAFIVVGRNGEVFRDFGTSPSTTNNRMEIEAVYNALLWIKQRRFVDVIIYSDSQYTVNSLTHWSKQRENSNWRKRFPNEDIIVPAYLLLKELKERNTKLKWVRGHNGNYWNEEADKLANNKASSVSLKNQIRLKNPPSPQE